MSELHPPEGPVNGGLLAGAPSEVPGKRQRRPSVRLGDIGDQPSTLSIEAYKRNRLWSDTKFRHFPQTGGVGGKSSKSRTLTNFGNGVDNHETLETEDGNLNRKGRDLKAKRGGTKRVRSNWVRKVDEGAERDEKLSSGEGGDEWYKGFDDAGEGSESPLKDQSLNESMENVGKDGFFPGQKRAARVRVSESRGDQGAVELDTDARDWNCRTSVDRDEGVRVRGSESREMCLEDGVRMWLNGLGLGRYEPVFEIHEVDEEVLPLLTLEDLKDMGINAVGSRRKLYSAIQKLGKGFS